MRLHSLPEHLPDLLKQGFTLGKALRKLQPMLGGQQFAPFIKYVENGHSFAEAVQVFPGIHKSRFELEIIRTGEFAGQLPQALEALVQYRQIDRKALISLLSGMVYPLLLILASLVVFPANRLLEVVQHSDWTGLLMFKLMQYGVLALLIAVPIIIWVELSHSTRERILLKIPAVSQWWKQRISYRFATVLSWGLLTEGSIGSLLEAAARCTGSSQLQLESQGWLKNCQEGKAPSLAGSRILPTAFAEHFSTAAECGQLQEKVDLLSKFYQQKEKDALFRLIAVGCTSLYLLGIILISAGVVSFYAGYFNLVMPDMHHL